MGLLVSFVLLAFPLELDAGAVVPVEGRLPRLVMAGNRPTLVWVDGRRQWLDGRDAGALFSVDLLPDGGTASEPGRPVVPDSRVAGPLFSDGLAVAGGSSGQVLVVWEDLDQVGQPLRRYAVRPRGGVPFNLSTGPSSVTGARPMAAAWAGDAGLISWPFDGGQHFSWVSRSGAVAPQGVTIGNVKHVAAASDPTGGVRVAWATDVGWSHGVAAPFTNTLFTPSNASGSFQWFGIEANGAALITHGGGTTVVRPLFGGSDLPVGASAVVTDTPSVAQLQPGEFYVGRVTSTGAQFFRLGMSGFPGNPFALARSVSVVALPGAALFVTDHPVQEVLELRSARTLVQAPVPAAHVGAMRRSPTVVWGGDRWLVGWEQGTTREPSLTLVAVSPGGDVLGAPFNRLGLVGAKLERLEDGGVVVTYSEGPLLRSAPVGVDPITLSLPSQSTPGAVATTLTFPNRVHIGPTSLSWASGPTMTYALQGFQAASGVDGRAWLLLRDSSSWSVRVYDPVNGPLMDTGLFMGTLAPGARRQGVISVRRAASGEPMALVGIHEGTVPRWLLVRSDGGISDAGTSVAFDPRGLGVAAAGPVWVRAATRFSAVPGVPSRVVLEVVSDEGRVTPLDDVPLDSTEPGVPVLAAGVAGEVGLAVPVLVDGDPRLKFTVVRLDGGPVPTEPDGGTIVDAGRLDSGVAVDAGAPVLDAGPPVDDAGVIDAGLGVDAGELLDAGLPDDDAGVVDAGAGVDSGVLVDAGVVDGGAGADAGAPLDAGVPPEMPPLLFLPSSCGCGAVDLGSAALALLLLRRRAPRR
ncbi:MAG: hypothetical protein SFW67_31575 [Myxococcaceae bacterium]|nr:hypothetical protein [Myxococcaceae bacterium]